VWPQNKKMAKLLAALNLPQVGEIKMLENTHPDDGTAQLVCVWRPRVAVQKYGGAFGS